MKYVFTGGGTLGHTNPAIAVAEKVRELDKNADILFIMRENGNENKLVQEHNFLVKTIPACGLEKNGKHLINTLSTTGKSIVKCFRIIQAFKPDVIFGTGGYVSFSPLLLGTIFKIPTFIHESNIIPGRVTKITSHFGGITLLNYDGTKERLPKSTHSIIVGNPILSDFSHINRIDARLKLQLKKDDILILSFGGSGGSKALNDIIMQVMNRYSQHKSHIAHIHATGEKYYKTISESFPQFVEEKNRCKILPKIENMAMYMQAADIVICRCGAATLSEISAVGKASILIPSPNVTDNHQLENGRYLSKQNAAILVEEKNLNLDDLIQKIDHLHTSKTFRKSIENNVKKLAKNDSAKLISELLISHK